MNAEPNLLPDSTRMSIREALKLNAWAGVAVATAFVARVWVHAEGLDGAARAAIALLPLIPALLYVRTIWGWIQGLDEFQRRLQMEAVCFASLCMLLISLAADLIRAAAQTTRFNFGWEGYFALTFFVYALVLAWANRRYR